MTSRQLSIVDALKAGSEDFTTMRQLAMRFNGLFRERAAEKLDEWLRDALSCGVFTMWRFAKTLRQDKSAVQNAVTEPWSNGQTEGQINRLKTLKRSIVWSSQHRIASRAHATASRLQFVPRVKQTPPKWLPTAAIEKIVPARHRGHPSPCRSPLANGPGSRRSYQSP